MVFHIHLAELLKNNPSTHNCYQLQWPCIFSGGECTEENTENTWIDTQLYCFGAEGGDRSVCVYAHIRMNTPHQQILTERGITCIRQKCLPGYRQQGQMPLNQDGYKGSPHREATSQLPVSKSLSIAVESVCLHFWIFYSSPLPVGHRLLPSSPSDSPAVTAHCPGRPFQRAMDGWRGFPENRVMARTTKPMKTNREKHSMCNRKTESFSATCFPPTFWSTHLLSKGIY